MPALDVLSGNRLQDLVSSNQMQALGGVRLRSPLQALLRDAAADLPAQRVFAQGERGLALEEERIRLEEAGLQQQARAQADAVRQQQRAQKNQIVGTALSGTAQLGTLAYMVAPKTVTGLLGLGGAGTGAAIAGAETGAAAAEVGLGVAPAAATPAAGGGTFASNLVGAAPGSVGAGVASGVAGAAVGYGAGKLVGLIPGTSAGARTGKGLGGAALGAGAGFLVGGPIGAIAGGLFGGLGGGGLCIILTACADNAEEIALAKRYRERYMSTEAKRGYYMLAEPIAARMQEDPGYCSHIRQALVLPLLRYAAHTLGETTQVPSRDDQVVAEAFVDLCDGLGRSVREYVRDTGEIV